MLLLLAVPILLVAVATLIFSVEHRKSGAKGSIRLLIYSVLGTLTGIALLIGFFAYDPILHPVLP